MPPLHLSSNFTFAGLGERRQYDYTRSGNPTRDALGDAGHDHVKENFLTTRHISDYLLLMLAMEHGDTDLSVLTASNPR